MAIKLDWDKWYKKIIQVLPQDVIGDKNTGLIQLATSKKAFERYIDIMTEPEPAEITKDPKKLARRAGRTICKVDKKTLIKYLTEDQRMVLLDDEEFYRLNPEYWDEFGMVIKE